MCRKIIYYLTIPFIAVLLCGGFQVARAANWAAMPPYNVLWPLWSPFYSPPDPLTGLPTPLLTELTRTTVLPVQPVLAWDPYWNPGLTWAMVAGAPPWLLYNTPGGLVFFDTLYGINPWPPSRYLDPATGAPVPIALLPGYSLLTTTPDLLTWLKATYLFDLSNYTYLLAYGNALGVSPTSLVTAAQAFGLPPL